MRQIVFVGFFLLASTSKMNHFHVVVCEQRRYNDWLITEKHATNLVENVRHVMGFNDPGINVTRGPCWAKPVSGCPPRQASPT